jgi:putative spermidine/putrescine transport system substrate-binding protein
MNQIKIDPATAGWSAALEGPGSAATGKPYFEIVRDELARNIAAGNLWPGVVLIEGPIASLLGVSRGPVKRALELLAEDGLIRRFGGRGYLVGGENDDLKPNRVNLLTLDLEISGEIQDYAQRAAWQKIYGEVAESVVACTPFGAYQISESAMCAHFKVSRTVVRDVLARLNHDGLIEKDRWSHWTAGPLTARDVKEHYEMRLLLEPAALRRSAPALARAEIEAMRARVAAARRASEMGALDSVEPLERDLHETCLAPVPNRRLLATIGQSRLPDVINRLFARHFGLHQTQAILDEHDHVFAELVHGEAERAAHALELHLRAAFERTRARLKVLSVLTAQAVAPYLAPLVEERGRKPKTARAERRARPPKRRAALRVLGRREILLEPVRRQAVKDLGFEIAFELVDGAEEIRQAVTRPESFDVYHQWHTVDLMWTASSIQPIDIARIAHWPQIEALALLRHDGAPICDDLFRQLYVQADGRLAARRTDRAAMLPTIHGSDSLGFLASLRQQLTPGEPDSWRWLIDERWRGKVAMLRDPTLGMIEAALAVEGAGILKFGDIANLSIEEIDAIIAILKEKKRSGHFRGLWETYEDAARLMERGGVVVQSIFSPAIIKLRRSGLDVASAMPVEGTRGWRSDLCLSARAQGETLEAAYAYLNWWLGGAPGAILARQGYYMSARESTRQRLSPAEWDYWYEGKPAREDLSDPFGEICVHAGEAREGGSYAERMSRVRVWNTIMDDHNYLARRWLEFLDA